MSNKLSLRDMMKDYLQPSTSNVQKERDGCCYAIVRNIPDTFHSKTLRNYFSGFVENGRFECFHFRHRTEVQESSEETKRVTCCCVIRFKCEEERNAFIADYHRSPWSDDNGTLMSRRCFVQPIKVEKTSTPSSSFPDESSSVLTEEDIRKLIELKPPAAMPKGNVGTPSEYFMEQISQCKLPSSLIAKLGLKTGRRRRKFESVPFEYGETNSRGYVRREYSSRRCEPVDDQRRRHTQLLETQSILGEQREADGSEDPTDLTLSRMVPDTDEGPDEGDDDNDQCEEWERHEALHDDVTEQDRTKEKKFEQEMEVVWEKGGPGLVWKMDKEYWDEREKGTDCDWMWADDWDVDYSVYFEGKSSGDKDARDAVEIREDEARRNGSLAESVFRQTKEKGRKRRRSGGEVERYNGGVGSKMMKRMGWTPGSGLGKKGEGRVNPVAIQMEEDAIVGREKTGMGYRGVRLNRTVEKKPVRHDIVSVYDEFKDSEKRKDSIRRLNDTDDISNEVLWRRKEPTHMKHK